MTLVVDRDRITHIFRTGERALPTNAEVHNLDGHFVIPGLIDGHVHVFAGNVGDSSDMAEARATELARMERVLLGGVTTVRSMGGACRASRELARRAMIGELVSPDIYFPTVVIGPAGLSWFHGARPSSSCFRMVDGPLDPGELVAAAKRTGATGIKLYGDLPAQIAQAIAEEAHRQGLIVWAHATLFPARPSELVHAGVDVLSHAGHLIWEAVDSLPGFAAEAGPPAPYAVIPPSDVRVEAVLRLMAERGTILDPTLLFYHLLATVPESADRDSLADRQAFEDARTWSAGVTRRARELGVPVAAGTDAIGAAEETSLPNLHCELELLVDRAGFSPLEAITSATKVAAQALGLEDVVGVLDVGKQADLVVLRSDPAIDIRNTRDIAFVMKRGKIISGPDGSAQESTLGGRPNLSCR
jgi:imidazolonepropionase-like amidohydrolase